ncbi:putative membrane protein YdjX (TVP38/TMEM64 family) [Ancylobacter aquaticus]|uniref:Phospholipase D n=1 Tax=Ancylobacter aquaticus TaxID=100 RepID=A0A4R1ICM7_ANCAQ|nr:VTT domain-containing protein [Ancylobacter aquaticus]TCK30999.1 putative membrane protein YdjX (TVP38/TMEM64 family) [Ancylobacter aquaticus]
MSISQDLIESAMAARPVPEGPTPQPQDKGGPVLETGRNVWRVESAARARVLVDGAAYFGALRAAMLEARETIHIAGWDLDSRMKLVGESGTAEDGLPETLAAFLSALVARNPRLRIRLLLWDYSVMFALERELAPIFSFMWSTPKQIELCLDDELPIGASHHQKIVVIDDSLAFSGGLDITGHRWDTPDHTPGDPLRRDPQGALYEPFHDVQMAVDGAAADALGALFRDRWKRAASERLVPARARGNRWPDALPTDFSDVEIGIARTLPAYDGAPGAREVETLLFDMIDSAERMIYVENQFITCERFTERLVARMKECPALEALMVTPNIYRSWIEQQVMGVPRERLRARLEQEGLADRARLVFPQVSAGDATVEVFVHAKILIVDDRMLRVGSANICNRSMGFDSECDLVIEARGEGERAGVAAIRDRLLGEHIGHAPEQVAELVAGDGLIAASRQGAAGRRLVELPRVATDLALPQISAIADPLEPLYDERASEGGGRRRKWPIAAALAGLAVLAALVIAWANSPFAEPDRIISALDTMAQRPWGAAAVVGIYVLGGLVVFPVSVLIIATVAVYGGWTGALLAGLGALASAVVTFFIGRHLGAGVVRRFIGPRINRIRRGLANQGILTVATMRMVPAAPFTFINLVAGAAGLRLVDFVLGTALGLMPGLVVLSALGHQIVEVISNPTLGRVLLLIGFVGLWIACSLGLQFLVARLRRSA